MNPADLALVFAAFFVAAASPGPATLAVSSVSASAGRGSGLMFGCGLGTGLAVWGLVAATGLGAALQAATHLLAALKVAGGLYLLWLGLLSARAALSADSGSDRAPGVPCAGMGRWFLRGLMLNLSNPKAVVAWMAALSVGLGADSGWTAIAAATLGCVAIGFAIYLGYAAAFSVAAVRRGYARCRTWIEGSVAAFFAIAGLALLRSAVSRGSSAS